MRGVVALIGLVAAGCATTADTKAVYSVHELIEQFDQLDGQTVRVRGWAAGCERRSEVCGLFATEDQARSGVIDGWANAVAKRRGFEMPATGRVILDARVVVTCHIAEGQICLERSGYLDPIAVTHER